MAQGFTQTLDPRQQWNTLLRQQGVVGRPAPAPTAQDELAGQIDALAGMLADQMIQGGPAPAGRDATLAPTIGPVPTVSGGAAFVNELGRAAGQFVPPMSPALADLRTAAESLPPAEEGSVGGFVGGVTGSIAPLAVPGLQFPALASMVSNYGKEALDLAEKPQLLRAAGQEAFRSNTGRLPDPANPADLAALQQYEERIKARAPYVGVGKAISELVTERIGMAAIGRGGRALTEAALRRTPDAVRRGVGGLVDAGVTNAAEELANLAVQEGLETAGGQQGVMQGFTDFADQAPMTAAGGALGGVVGAGINAPFQYLDTRRTAQPPQAFTYDPAFLAQRQAEARDFAATDLRRGAPPVQPAPAPLGPQPGPAMPPESLSGMAPEYEQILLEVLQEQAAAVPAPAPAPAPVPDVRIPGDRNQMTTRTGADVIRALQEEYQPAPGDRAPIGRPEPEGVPPEFAPGVVGDRLNIPRSAATGIAVVDPRDAFNEGYEVHPDYAEPMPLARAREAVQNASTRFQNVLVPADAGGESFIVARKPKPRGPAKGPEDPRVAPERERGMPLQRPATVGPVIRDPERMTLRALRQELESFGTPAAAGATRVQLIQDVRAGRQLRAEAASAPVSRGPVPETDPRLDPVPTPQTPDQTRPAPAPDASTVPTLAADAGSSPPEASQSVLSPSFVVPSPDSTASDSLRPRLAPDTAPAAPIASPAPAKPAPPQPVPAPPNEVVPRGQQGQPQVERDVEAGLGDATTVAARAPEGASSGTSLSDLLQQAYDGRISRDAFVSQLLQGPEPSQRAGGESNPRPSDLESDALPTELTAQTPESKPTPESQWFHRTTPEAAESIRSGGFRASETGDLGPGVYLVNDTSQMAGKWAPEGKADIPVGVRGKLLKVRDGPNTGLNILEALYGRQEGSTRYDALSKQRRMFGPDGIYNWDTLHGEVKAAGYVGLTLERRGVSGAVIFDPADAVPNQSTPQPGDMIPPTPEPADAQVRDQPAARDAGRAGQPARGPVGGDVPADARPGPSQAQGPAQPPRDAQADGEGGRGDGARGVREPDREGSRPAPGPRDGAVADAPDAARGRGDRQDGGAADGRREGPGVGAGERADQPDAPANAGNHIIDPAELGAGGPKAKFRGNVEALRTLNTILAEGRPATREEQRTLAGYVGWGMFPQVFDYSNREWKAERETLQSLLTDEQFAAARRSTTNAHYTSARVVTAMWDMARKIGFAGGRVLEPSMGTGNFFGLMPAELRNSRLTGVELEPVTGSIAKLLYPNANVQVMGFQDLTVPDGFFDLAIGNVPFGDYRVADKKYDRHRAFIHDYFFLKSLDKVRPGGAVMFVTSTGTMDKLDGRVREALAAKADLVAAVRLPGGAFQQNAGTAVVTDVVILRRRADGEAPGGPAWAKVVEVPDPAGGPPIPVNEYYAANPAQILGRLDRSGTMYRGQSVNVSVTPDFEERFRAAVDRLPANVITPAASAVKRPERSASDVSAKNGAFIVEGGKVSRRVGDEVVSVEADAKTAEKIAAHIAVRDAMRQVFDAQLSDRPERVRKETRRRLNAVYDSFVKQHGPLHSRPNVKAFGADPDHPVLLALERYDPATKKATKAAIFEKDTVRPAARETSAKTISDAVGVSLNETGRIDPDRIAALLDVTPEKAAADLVDAGLAFLDPSGGFQPKDVYLSGNVKAKLADARAAARIDPSYQANVKALEAVQPPDIPAEDIDVKLGSPWIPGTDYAEFAASLLGADAADFSIRHVAATGQWVVSMRASAESRFGRSATVTEVYGTPRAPFLDVLDAAMNNQLIRLYDKDAQGNRTFNPEDSAAANAKVSDVKERFGEWVWQDDARKERLHRFYNDNFNNVRNVEYDGSFLTFPGMNPGIELRPHQKNAVWLTLSKGKALYAHEVGTGKTYTQIAAAMEMRRLGLARKPAIAVLKSTIEQFAEAARTLYPGARILTTDDKFDAKSRKRTVSQIATGDWDLVILTHDNIDMLPMRPANVERFIREELDELETVKMAVAETEKRGSRFVKALEKQKERLLARLEEAIAGGKGSDDAVTFEESGIDFLFVDEAHKYKTLPVYTQQDRIKGVPTGRSDRATTMYMRSRWLMEQNKGRGLALATGTPISNTVAELFTMQRYLQHDELRARGIAAFDSWATMFTDQVTKMEAKATGAYEPTTRMARFVNLPEMNQIARQLMDVRLADDMPQISRPKRRDEVIAAPRSEDHAAFIAEIRARAEKLKGGKVDPREDNMLKVSSDARKASLDLRLIGPEYQDDPESKVNRAVGEILRIHRENPGKTQLVFSDIGVNPTPWGFSVFGDIRDKLVAAGIPADKILLFTQEMTDAEKATAADRIKRGDALIGMGSTDKLGTGVNAQDYLIALHHLDVPWLPAAVEQRDGRGWRQGNTNPSVFIKRYVTEGTFDTFMWQLVDTKSRFIKQFMREGDKQRTVKDDDGEELSPAQIMAVASDDPRILEKVTLEDEIRQLEGARRRFARDRDSIAARLAKARSGIDYNRKLVEAVRADAETAKANPADGVNVTIAGKVYTDKEAAAVAFFEAEQAALTNRWALERDGPKQIGEYRGFKIMTGPDGSFVQGAARYPLPRGNAAGWIGSMNVQLSESALARKIADIETAGRASANDVANLEAAQGKTFKGADELAAKRARVAAIEEELKPKKDAPADPPPGAVGIVPKGARDFIKAMEILEEQGRRLRDRVERSGARGIIGLWYRAFGRATSVLDRLGPEGRTLSRQTERIAQRAQARGNADVLDFNSAMQGVSREDRGLIGRIANNYADPKTGRPYAELRPDLARVAERVRDIADRARVDADRVRRRDTGERVGFSGEWYPQVPTPEGREFLDRVEMVKKGVFTDPEVAAWAAAEVLAGRASDTDEALAGLMDYYRARGRGVNRYFERPRVKLPEKYVSWDIMATMPGLLHKNALFVEAVDRWGWAFTQAKAAFAKIGREHGRGSAEMLDRWLRANFDAEPENEALRKYLGGWSNFETLTRLGGSVLSVIQNATQGVVNSASVEPAALLRAVREYPPIVGRWLRSGKAAGEAADRAGATSDVTAFSSPEGVAPLARTTELALTPFSAVERDNQVVAARAGYHQLLADMDRLTAAAYGRGGDGPVRSLLESAVSFTGLRDTTGGAARRAGRLLGMTDKELVARIASGERLSARELAEAQYRATSSTQFVMDLASEPVWWRNNPALRLAFKFKNWTFRQTEMIYDHVAREAFRGNFGPLVRFALATLIAGELVQLIRDMLRGREESAAMYLYEGGRDPKEIASRAFNSMKQAGAFGFVVDMTYGLGDWLGGPALGTLRNAGDTAIDLARARGNPRTSLAVVDRALTDQVSAYRFAKEAGRAADGAFASPETRRAREYMLWRARAGEFSGEADAKGVGDVAVRTLENTIEGRYQRFRGNERTAPLAFAAQQIDVGDVDDAARYMAEIVRSAPPEERDKLMQAFKSSARIRSPLGRVALKDRDAWLAGFPPAQARKADELQNKWMDDYMEAVSRAYDMAEARPEPPR